MLLDLLGLRPPEGALRGLDSVLVGLRTRDLLQQLVEARCRLSQVILVIEDLHWIDSISEELLGMIAGGETRLRLLLVHTRRPEYEPSWLNRPVVTKLHLEPLPAGDILHLVQSRLGVDAMPEALARQVTERVEGNPLFAEEIASFLAERGVLRAVAEGVEFDASAVATALPASLQSLLTARVDLLASRDRALLQAAAAIGRRFDPQLLAVAVDGGGDISARLGAMQSLDLVYPEGPSGDYAFKHALARDALYQSLLTGPRVALHLRIAEEIERHSANRLAEVVETLAYHFGQTERADKAFGYLAMAGSKSLGIYSLDDASKYFAAAIALLDAKPDCANDQQLAELLIDFAFCANLSMRLKSTIEIVERFLPRLARLGDNPKCIQIFHHYISALVWSGRYREAEKARISLSAMATRLNDERSTAYTLTSTIFVSSYISPLSVQIFETLSREALTAASNVNEAYLQYFIQYVVGLEEYQRGRMSKSQEAAEELMSVGRRLNDPRSTGLGMLLLAARAVFFTDYAAAVDLAENSMNIARAPLDVVSAKNIKTIALVLLNRPGAMQIARDWMDECAANDWQMFLSVAELVWGAALLLNGEIGAGIRWTERAILRREREGHQYLADAARTTLCEIYLEIISGNEKPPLKVVLRNMLTLAAVILTAEKRICALVERVRQNPEFDPNGFHIGRCETILGLLYKTKKRRALAVQHLTEAKRIISQFGPSPPLAKIDAALAEVG